jgi:hypothetical protein
MKRPHGPALPLLYQHALRLRDPTHVLAGELDELNPLREEGGKGDGECHMPVPTLEPLGEPGKKTAPSSISPKVRALLGWELSRVIGERVGRRRQSVGRSMMGS